MNELAFPTGRIVASSASLSTHNAFEILRRQLVANFTGYFAITIQGKSGLEDGVLGILKGKVVAASYYYHKFETLFVGREAVERVENAFASQTGVFDLVELTPEQVSLALHASKAPELNVASLHKVNKFSEEMESKDRGQHTEHSERSELLKRYGLSALANG